MDKRNRVYEIIFIIVLIIILIYSIAHLGFTIYNYEDNVSFDEYYDLISDENNYYKDLKNNINENDIQLEPYIPDEFKYSLGTVDEGYVIEDDVGNQFVWIPCSKETLKKSDFISDAFIKYSECYDDNYEDFLKSALVNGGFYISRFETGIEDGDIVSKSGAQIYSNVTKNEISEKVNNMYTDKDFMCEIINGYAYDRTLQWIIEDTEVEIYDNEIYDDDIPVTGKVCYKNVYDLFDDMFEITSENYFNCIVYRGFTDISLDISGTSDKWINSMDNRFVADENYTYKAINTTSRLVLYK